MPVTGNTELTRPENRAFFPALDGLRAIAFLMVFFDHYYGIPWGWTGVNIFFVLSGFLITGILFDTRNDLHRARNFYVRRTLRIFPLYYGVFLALVLLYPVFHWKWSVYWLAWPLYLANFLRIISPSAVVANSPINLAANGYLHSPLLHSTTIFLSHFWTLCVEEQFYLVWPWFVFGVRERRPLLWICGASVVIVPLLRFWVQHTAPAWLVNGGLFNVTPFQIDSLLLGGLLALLWRGAYQKRLVAVGRTFALFAIFPIVAYLIHSVHSASPNWREGYHYPHWTPTWGLSFVDFVAAALVLCCLSSTGWFVRILTQRPLCWLGRMSYGAYVFHDIFHALYGQAARTLGRHFAFCNTHWQGVQITIGLISTLALASFSFRYFESPFLNLKERWTLRAAPLSSEQRREGVPSVRSL